jgi:hypothetical protein
VVDVVKNRDPDDDGTCRLGSQSRERRWPWHRHDRHEIDRGSQRGDAVFVGTTRNSEAEPYEEDRERHTGARDGRKIFRFSDASLSVVLMDHEDEPVSGGERSSAYARPCLERLDQPTAAPCTGTTAT